MYEFMTTHYLKPTTLALAAAFVLAACGSSGDQAGAGQAAATPASSFNAIEQDAATASAVACTPDDGGSSEITDWPVGGSDQPEIIPIVASSLVSAEPTRFLYSITDGNYQVLTSPDVDTMVSFYALERDAETPTQTVQGIFLDTQISRGLYRASVDFDCAGEWGAQVTAELEDGTIGSERIRFQVHPVGTTPAIGQPAPLSDSPTGTTVAELQAISTDPVPFPGAYERTVAEVVTGGQPSLVFFATPAFCQTGYCGPTVNLVKSVAIDYQDEIGFVNVEPYELRQTENGLQPKLDEEGQLQPVQAVLDYGIPVEPYLFLVDAQGDVFAKFEGVVGADELRAAIEDALADAA
jgi:hypothetical protein